MKAKPKVLFLARWYPNRYDPMIGLFIKRHAEVAAGFADVSVLHLQAAPEKPIGYHIENQVDKGVSNTIVYYGTGINLHPLLKKLFAGFLFVSAFIKGYRFNNEIWGKPDIIHVNILTRLGLLALWLKFFSGINYVITEHWSRYLPVTGTYKGLFRKWSTKLVVRNAASVSTVSENLAKAMWSHGLKNSHYLVLPNIVDTGAYVPRSWPRHDNKKRFMHISCFEDRSKNISGLLRVVSKLSAIRDDFEFVLVGEGIDLEKLKALAQDLGLAEHRVKFTGLLENEELIAEYQSVDFMVMFSNYENMPVVISESFSCGLPVIASSVGGIPEYINNKNGILVPPGDETALLDAISFMLDNFNQYDSGDIRHSAIQNFGNQAVSDKLKELYSYVIH